MKFLNFIIVLVFITACNSGNKKKNISNKKDVAERTEWLRWNSNKDNPHIVLVSGDEEYRSEEALPMLAKILSERHGFRTTVLFAQDPKKPGIVNPNYGNNIPGLEVLASADLMIIFTRFRALPDEQMKNIDDYLKSGKPVIGIRTSTHAFMFENATFTSNYKHYGNSYKEDNEWKDGFGRLVMGEHWIAHHGKHGHQSTRGLISPEAKNHPITNGIEDGDIWGPTDVYEVRLPLPVDSQPIVLGQVTERINEYDENDPLLGMRPSDSQVPGVITTKDEDGNILKSNQNDPMMPIAWIKTYKIPGGKPGKCFSSTIGSSTDLLTEGTRRLIVNAVFWALDIEIPQKANVDIVGDYSPSRFKFHTDDYWNKKNMKISELK